MKLSLRLTNAGLLSIVGLIVAVLLLADLAVRRTVPPVSADRIVTKEFVLLDSAGRTRARIAVDENDSPSLQMYDKHGTKRAQLRLNQDDVPSLRYYNANGKIDSVLGYNLNSMEPGLIFFNSFGEGKLVNTPVEDVFSSKVFLDADLHPEWATGQQRRSFQWSESQPSPFVREGSRNSDVERHLQNMREIERSFKEVEEAREALRRERWNSPQRLDMGDSMFHEE